MTNFRVDEAFIRAESNLEEYPLFAVKSRNRKEDQLVFERRRRGEDGTELVQRWEVEPPAKLGMPGPFDQDIYLAVLQLLEVRGGMAKSGELSFSLYELREILGWSSSGNTYEKIRQSLRRISSTTLTSENAFYSKSEERFLSDTFQIWTIHFSRTRRGRSFTERHTLSFHPIFIRNYIAQYLKGLDPAFYWSLDSPLSKRLYRLIDHQRGGGLSWTTDLFSLREQVPLSNYSYPSEIKRALSGAHEELAGSNFLSGVEYDAREGLTYHVAREFARRQKARELSGNPRELFAIERLVAEGLPGDVARDLVTRFGSEKCLRYADALDSRKGVRNRAGWLRKAIEEEFEITETLPLMLFEQAGDTGATEQNDPTPLPTADPSATEAWEGLLEVLYEASGFPDSLSTWFEGFTALSLEGGSLRVAAPNSVAADYVADRFGPDLSNAWSRISGEDASLRIE